MKINWLYQNARRLCTRRMLGSYLITTILCSIACVVFMKMNRSLAQANITMLLCGGNMYENEFAFRCSIWLLPAFVFTLHIGKGVEDERQCYKHIAMREGDGVYWYILEASALLFIAILCSAMLILVPSALMVTTEFRYWNMKEVFDAVSDKTILTHMWQLWAVNSLRLTRNGMIQLWCMIGRRRTAQIGLLLVLLIELMTFFDVGQQYALYSFADILYGVVDFSRIMVQNIILLSIYFVIGVCKFRRTMTNGEL